MKLPPLTLIQQSPDLAVLEMTMPPSLDAFHDHFPNHPLLPGVVQVDWAVRLAADHLGLHIPSARDFQVKFRGIIRPEMTVTLTLKRDTAKNQLSFTYQHKDEIMSSGTVKLGIAA